MAKELNARMFSAMQTENPVKSYIKTMLGKVYVTVLNPITGEPEGLILYGNPRGKDKDKCIVDVWTETEDIFFRRINKRHFEQGHLMPFERKPEEAPKERSQAEYTDSELNEKILSQPFARFQSMINKIELQAVLMRLITLAKEQDKSDRIIKIIEARLSTLQEDEYKK